MVVVTRFAPSPTGPLHLGHAYSAMLAHDMARAEGGTFLLRFEDIDQTRCRPDWTAHIMDDLHWLGVTWNAAPMLQSGRRPIYQKALDDLWSRDLLFPCACSRRDVDQALDAPQEGVAQILGPDGPIYPGTCRSVGDLPRNRHVRPNDRHLRLDMALASRSSDAAVCHNDTNTCGVSFTETGPSHAGKIVTTPADFAAHVGDIILARRDFGTSYHLSVVLDDAAQGITHVTRGEDLVDATRIHVLLQRLLVLPTPIYHHHRLIRDATGKRLAKRDDARALSKYRAEGATPDDIRRLVSL